MSIANIIALTVATMSLIICFVNYFSSVGTKYKKYKKFVEYIRNGYDYGYGTYKDFLREFNKINFKDYIKYKMFFRKMSRKAVKEENEEIKLMRQRAIEENRIEKWNK